VRARVISMRLSDGCRFDSTREAGAADATRDAD
jgi:hypothetical protein